MQGFKIYNCDFGIKINGQSYDFEEVVEAQIEDPERNNLTRGSNAKNKVGISYKEGLREPKRLTIPIIGMSIELKEVLDSAYASATRLETFCIDRTDGSSFFFKNAVLANRPIQLAVDESAESMNVSLEFVSFDLTTNFKS